MTEPDGSMRSVPLTMYLKDVKIKEEDGYSFGVWDYTPGRKVWGLLYGEAPTSMCYELVYGSFASPRKLIGTREDKNNQTNDPEWLKWYFDVGRDLWAHIHDVQQAMEKLDIW